MTSKLRILAAAVLLLAMAGMISAHPTFAAGGQITDCSFATLQADLQSGGDWYYTLGQCTAPITVTSTVTLWANASLAAYGNDVTLDGANSAQLFSVGSGISFGLTGLTLSDGVASAGGAIENWGTLSITDSTLSGNRANGGGGAIHNDGTASITSSTVSGNSATGEGGAIENTGTLTIGTSTLSGNHATDGGGAIYNHGTASITSSTLADNLADVIGGAIDIEYDGAITSIANSTLVGNSARYGGGINNDYGAVSMSGSIVAGNSPGDCRGAVTDQGYNLANGADCGFTGTGSLQNANPKLGPLTDNGGPTQTMALQQGSPAIDAVPTSSGLCPSTDQRGSTRPDDGETFCDIGAYESAYAITPTATNLTSSANPSVVGQQVTYTAAVSPAPDGGTVDFQDNGSDIASCAQQPVDTLQRAVLALGSHGRTGYVDVLRVTCLTRQGQPMCRYALAHAVSGVLAEATALEVRPGIRRLGQAAYLWMGLRAVLSHRAYEVVYLIDGHPVYQGLSHGCLATNTVTMGAGLQVAPEARLDDGRAEVAMVGLVGRRRLLTQLLPGLRDGSYRSHPDVSHWSARSLALDSPQRVPLAPDGEPVGSTPAEITVLHRVLPVALPPAAARTVDGPPGE